MSSPKINLSAQSLSVDLLREVLDYDQETGLLWWRERPAKLFRDGGTGGASAAAARWNALHSGRQAFTTRRRVGYLQGRIFDWPYLAHRVAWAVHFGEWPAGEIDHINGAKDDNKIANLRNASRVENARNQSVPRDNKSGHIGVSFETGKWRAQIMADGRRKHLGLFDSIEAAAAARKAAEREHGYHPNHGRSL